MNYDPIKIQWRLTTKIIQELGVYIASSISALAVGRLYHIDIPRAWNIYGYTGSDKPAPQLKSA